MSEPLVATIERHLAALVDRYPDRHPGRPGNTTANDYAEAILRAHHWGVESVDFEVLDADERRIKTVRIRVERPS